MTEQTAPAPTADTGPSYKRLTQGELGAILALRREGKTQTQIALAIGCDQTAISQALKRLGADTTELATHHAKANSYHAVRRLDRVTRKGKDGDAIKAASKLLEVAGLGVADSKGVNVGVQVVIGMPGQPAGPDPLERLRGESAIDIAPITVQSSESLSNS